MVTGVCPSNRSASLSSSLYVSGFVSVVVQEQLKALSLDNVLSLSHKNDTTYMYMNNAEHGYNINNKLSIIRSKMISTNRHLSCLNYYSHIS